MPHSAEHHPAFAGNHTSMELPRQSIDIRYYEEPETVAGVTVIDNTLQAPPLRTLYAVSGGIYSLSTAKQLVHGALATSTQQKNVFTDTFDRIGELPSPSRVDFALLQAGQLAYHFVHRVHGERGEVSHFVSYVSRYPISGKFGNYARFDYDHLSRLFSQLHALKATSLYQSAQPISYGGIYSKGREYPVFTTHLIDPKLGEVHADYIPYGNEGKTTIGYPVYSYPLDTDAGGAGKPHRRWMEDQINNDKQQLTPLIQRGISLDMLKKAIRESPTTKGLIHVQKQLAGALAVYVVALGGAPSEFQINAGDIMAEFLRFSVRQTALTSVRGDHLSPIENSQDWVQWVRSLRCMDAPGTIEFQPFDSLTDRDHVVVFDRAKSLVD